MAKANEATNEQDTGAVDNSADDKVMVNNADVARTFQGGYAGNQDPTYVDPANQQMLMRHSLQQEAFRNAKVHNPNAKFEDFEIKPDDSGNNGLVVSTNPNEKGNDAIGSTHDKAGTPIVAMGAKDGKPASDGRPVYVGSAIEHAPIIGNGKANEAAVKANEANPDVRTGRAGRGWTSNAA